MSSFFMHQIKKFGFMRCQSLYIIKLKTILAYNPERHFEGRIIMFVSEQEFKRRKKVIREAMAKEDVDIILVGGSNKWEQRGMIRYLTGYYVPIFEEYILLPGDGPLTFFAHYSYGAKHAHDYPAIECADFIPLEDINRDPGKRVAKYINDYKPKKLGVTRTNIAADFYLSLIAHLDPRIEIIDFTNQFDLAKMPKSDEEIALSEKGIKVNEDAFFAYLKCVKEGGREVDAVAEASYAVSKAGCEDQYWMCGSGATPAQGSMPLALERNHVWKKGDLNVVIIEIAGPGGHFGEITHLISLGDPDPSVIKAFNAVSEAQKLAARAIKPGVPIGDVADLVDQYFIDEGYYPKVKEDRASATTGNLIGHGQGLDTMEPPYIISGGQTIIQPGTRVNIHPNLALPSGVRAISCDCHIATETGSRRLSNMPYDLIVL